MSRFAVSPDGRFLAFLGMYGNIHLVSAKVTNFVVNMQWCTEWFNLNATLSGVLLGIILYNQSDY